ncbi:hypothetical protein HFC64_03180 [Saccharolobus solfataricus]|uniref:Uncharacterized protein n=1 Tax=Saccharolobus solfataricus TaxID=2287 RepID=A0A7S9IH40_SACSO|nr:hypothetical protein [Saccharolobus solfataricus]QPG49037.1 hypothetical protein HFC64_03180 [Saccharolobus solfataricus]
MCETSLVLSFLTSIKVNYLYLDAWRFEEKEYINFKDFIEVVEKENNNELSSLRAWRNS